jgi:DNA end-binding protein Ku
MAARSIATATISFGLVTVPIRVYPATRLSAGLSFHMLHAKDNVCLKQQYVCPKDDEVVPRSEMVKGYEYRKDKYVVFSTEELKALDEQATNGIEITEFLPADAVDPVYHEKTYYLGPDKGGEKAYSLLSEAMEDAGRVALANYAARGKGYLVLLRATGGRLMMQQLFHADEVRDVAEVPAGNRQNREAEVKLARQLIDQIAEETFRPERYEDVVRKRIEKLIQSKLKGKDITAPAAAERPKAEVIDLMEALKASLGRKKAAAAKPAARMPAASSRPAARAAAGGRKK